MIVHDVDRPDVGGVPPKMKAVCETVKAMLEELGLPDLKVTTDDNLGSSVLINGSWTADPPGNIWHNGLCFQIWINPAKGKRYYEEGERVSLELSHCSYKLAQNKLRKYTGPVDKVIDKLRAWVESNRPSTDTE
jgi:hypothetical protein